LRGVRLVLGEAIEWVAERDMAAREKYPFAKAVSFGVERPDSTASLGGGGASAPSPH